jgi:hypothetical protein
MALWFMYQNLDDGGSDLPETHRRAYASEAYLLAGRIHQARDTA